MANLSTPTPEWLQGIPHGWVFDPLLLVFNNPDGVRLCMRDVALYIDSHTCSCCGWCGETVEPIFRVNPRRPHYKKEWRTETLCPVCRNF